MKSRSRALIGTAAMKPRASRCCSGASALSATAARRSNAPVFGSTRLQCSKRRWPVVLGPWQLRSCTSSQGLCGSHVLKHAQTLRMILDGATHVDQLFVPWPVLKEMEVETHEDLGSSATRARMSAVVEEQ